MKNFSWQSDQACRLLVDALPDGIFVAEDTTLVYVNQQLATMLGYTIDEMLGRSFLDFVADDDQPLVWERSRARLAGEKVPEQYDAHLLAAHNTVIFCSLNVSLKQTESGEHIFVGTVRDVTRQKKELAELELSKSELEAIFQQLPDVFYRTSMTGMIDMISPSCYGILGYRQEAMLGTAMADYYETPADRQKVVQAITEGGGKATWVEAGLRHKDGSIVWISTNAIVRFGPDGQPCCIEGVARDISERKRMEDRLTLLSRTDGLTSVFSRGYFMDKAEEVIRLMKRYQRPASLLMMDLDHFKAINDNYGHHVGDLALLTFTRACRKVIRESDVLGRLGGEEFAVMLPETSLESAEILAERIRKATAEISIPAGARNISFTVSIGLVALLPGQESLDHALHCADLAMYQAKERGRNQTVIFAEPA